MKYTIKGETHHPSKKPPRIVDSSGREYPPGKVPKIVAGQSEEIPPISELERLRDERDYYRQRARRAEARENALLKIAFMQESGYIDAILRLVQARVGINSSGQEQQDSAAKFEKLRDLDPTNQRIWDWIQEDPSITDTQIGQRLDISRVAVNVRRQIIISSGYPAKRKVSRQK